MPEKLPPASIRNFVNGVYREAEVSDFIKPEGSAEEAINVHFDSKGAVTQRNGMTALGNQIVASKNILGLHDARELDNTDRLLSVVSDGTNNDVYYLDSSTWTKTLENDTKDLKTRFVTFLGLVARLNGTDAPATWNGDTGGSWITTGGDLDVGDMPNGKFGDVLKARMYVSGNDTNPDRLFYSGVAASGGTIAWDTPNDFVDINPNDGDNVTGIKRYGLEMTVFKKDYMYRYRGIAGTDPDPLISVGTHSYDSIVPTKAGLYFHHPTGIYVYAGGYPEEISRPVSDFTDNMSSANYTEVAGWEDGDHVYQSIGNVTIGSVTFTNVVLRYTISSQVWTIYSTDSQIRIGTKYISGTDDNRILGNSNGYVLTWDSGTTDNGTAIASSLVTKYYDLGAISHSKVIDKISFLCRNAQGLKVYWQADDGIIDAKWYPIGQLNKFITLFKGVGIKGHRIRFKLTNISSSAPYIFEGIEILDGVYEGLIE